MNNETLATELLHELKASTKRWFIAFIVVLILWFSTTAIFIWYVSLPVEVSEVSEISQEIDSGENIIQQVSGGDNDVQGKTND